MRESDVEKCVMQSGVDKGKDENVSPIAILFNAEISFRDASDK
jgi:hypothetical protein